MQSLEQREGFTVPTLLNTVLRIESARRVPQMPLNGAILPPLYQMALEQGVNPNSQIAQAIIRQNPQFLTMRDEVLISSRPRPLTLNGISSSEQSLESYVQLLGSDGSLEVKLFATSDFFQQFIKDVSKEGGLGPIFQTVLGVIRQGDAANLAFVEQSAVALTALNNNYAYLERLDWFFETMNSDHNWVLDEMESREDLVLHALFNNIYYPYSQYKGRKLREEVFSDHDGQAEIQRVLSAYTKVADAVLGMIFDQQDDSALKRFMVENFKVIFTTLFALDQDLRDYEPEQEYERLKRLFEKYANGDWEFFAKYLLYSKELWSVQGGTYYDENLMTDDDLKPRIFVQYAEGMHEALQNLDPEDFAIDTYIQEGPRLHNMGAFSNEDLLGVAEKTKVMAGAFFALPEQTRRRFGRYPFFHILTSYLKDYFDHTELVTKLITSGIIPYKKMLPLLDQQPDKLATILQFGDALLEMDFQGVRIGSNGEIHLLNDFVVQFLEGELIREELSVTAAEFLDSASNLVAINNAIRIFSQSAPNLDLTEGPIEAELEKIYAAPYENPRGVTALIALLSAGILPTERLVAYIKEHGDKGMAALLQLRQDTREGRFNPGNSLQKDLEYFKYLNSPRIRRQIKGYDHFSLLPYSDSENNDLRIPDRMEAAAAAYEAGNLYWFIREGLDFRRKKLVIGNERFGNRFCVDPLRRELEELGIGVHFYYVHSMIPNDNHDFEKVFPASFGQYLVEGDYPNIVVVDGSNESMRDNKPRLPSAHIGYLGWFLAYNEALGIKDYLASSIEGVLRANKSYHSLVDRLRTEAYDTPYHIAFWTPQKGTEVYIGNHLVSSRDVQNNGPQLILANPIIVPEKHTDLPLDLKGHQPGYFNDPDQRLPKGDEMAFTRQGFEILHHGMNEEYFIHQVQMAMIANLPQMIRRTNPLSSI